MAKLKNNDDTLRQCLPNVFATVKGEVSLFDKVKVDIDLAENWVIETFVSTKTFNTICGYADDNPIKIITAKLIASEALRRAIPSLDLVLTPNGLGVVSNQNIAPASKERVDRLIGSLADYRDECIASCRHLSVRVSGSLPRRHRSSGKRCFPTSPSPNK